MSGSIYQSLRPAGHMLGIILNLFYASGTQDAEVTKSLENVQREGLNFQGAFNSREVQP